MSTKFSNLLSPLQVGNHKFRNRIESAPAIFGFCHLIEFPFGIPPRLPERSMRMIEDKAKGGCASVVLGEMAPNHTNSKRFPFEPEINFKDFNDQWMYLMKKNAEAVKKYGAIALAEMISVGESKIDLKDNFVPRDQLISFDLMEFACGRCYPGPTGEHETERENVFFLH